MALFSFLMWLQGLDEMQKSKSAPQTNLDQAWHYNPSQP